MFERKILTLAILVASFALLAPSALARGGHHGGPGERDTRGGVSIDRQDVPSRISSRLKRASRALDRAEKRVDDGETARAISSLASVRKNVASAQKSGTKRVTANAGDGPASAWALTPEAQTALNEVKTQAQATQAKVRALLSALGSSNSSASQVADGDGEGAAARRRSSPILTPLTNSS